MTLEFVESKQELRKSWEDVAEERVYRQNALVGYVVGDNVPFSIMSGFGTGTANWKGVVTPEILLHEKGLFISDLQNWMSISSCIMLIFCMDQVAAWNFYLVKILIYISEKDSKGTTLKNFNLE
ncbi:hypothetical protein Droror1_Dr00015831 [Drosera rotundifolia]